MVSSLILIPIMRRAWLGPELRCPAPSFAAISRYLAIVFTAATASRRPTGLDVQRGRPRRGGRIAWALDAHVCVWHAEASKALVSCQHHPCLRCKHPRHALGGKALGHWREEADAA